ncbi:trypsin-like serine protease [Aggregicoccus sp. 17bor-14]|nr:trypsin-like serine protease [Simulacricoccus sp. 17bor-14]MRI87407.1 trypsin-like serine protease [Aggregicoccus sp. 17bor-14]
MLLLLLLAACAPEVGAPVGERRQAVVSGTGAPADGAVVALVARRTHCTGEAPVLLCSGALVAPDVVLTAAHCLEVLGEDGQYEVFVGAQLLPTPQGRFLRVKEVRVHPGYVRATHARDVALLRLALPASEAPLALPEADEVPSAGLAVRALGFGDTHSAEEPAGVRRQGALQVASVTDADFLAGPAPSMSCTGDSGGPVLGSPRGREVLLGVTSSGDVACRSEAVQVRVDAVLEDFVRPFLAQGPAQAAPAAPFAPEALCREACDSDARCPAGLACVADAQGVGRCMLLNLREGLYAGACSEDAACGVGGTCARLESEGEDACRCFSACAPAAEDGGCAVGAGGASGLSLSCLLSLLARRRARAGRRAPPG